MIIKDTLTYSIRTNRDIYYIQNKTASTLSFSLYRKDKVFAKIYDSTLTANQESSIQFQGDGIYQIRVGEDNTDIRYYLELQTNVLSVMEDLLCDCSSFKSVGYDCSCSIPDNIVLSKFTTVLTLLLSYNHLTAASLNNNLSFTYLYNAATQYEYELRNFNNAQIEEECVKGRSTNGLNSLRYYSSLYYALFLEDELNINDEIDHEYIYTKYNFETISTCMGRLGIDYNFLKDLIDNPNTMADRYTDLNDTPNNLIARAFQRVNEAGSALENVLASAIRLSEFDNDLGVGATTYDGLSDTPNSKTALAFQRVNQAGSAIEGVLAANISLSEFNNDLVLGSGDLEYVNVKSHGAIGDGVADDTTALNNAKAAAGSTKVLFFPTGTYKISSRFIMPTLVKGDFTITGAPIRWEQLRRFSQEGRIYAPDGIELSGLHYGRLEYLRGGSVVIDGNASNWGVFWNRFDFIDCTSLVLDCDQGQSINQNLFMNVRTQGGLHIRGTNTSGIREAHNNIFQCIDTTGSDLTSGTITGIHILNDSDMNQANTIIQWYAEGAGRGLAVGNWNILVNQNNYPHTNFSGDRNNSQLFSSGDTRNGSFIAMSTKDISESGDWSRINPDNGRPINLEPGGGVVNTVVEVDDAPDSNPLAIEFSAPSTFQEWHINYKLTSNPFVSLTAYIKITDGGVSTANQNRLVTVYVQNANGDTGINNTKGTLTPVGNDWYLLRAAYRTDRVLTSTNTTGRLQVFIATGTASTEVWTIGSFFVSGEEVCPLPQYKGGTKTGVSDSVPTHGFWNVHDIVYHTEPSQTNGIGWICTAAGNPGTWSQFGYLDATASAPNVRLATATGAGNPAIAELRGLSVNGTSNAIVQLRAISESTASGRSGFTVHTRDNEGNINEAFKVDNLKQSFTYNNFLPFTDDSFNLGRPNLRFDTIYATNNIISTSDAREKQILGESLGLDFIKKLNPVTFKFNNKIRPHQGIIAQELKQVIDELGIDFAGWILGDLEDENSIQGVRYAELIPPLIKAVQELSSNFDSIKTDLENIKNSLNQ